ncbi:hypothetical protein F5X96DRAFT_610378 [Biscogniauxia mediterranea]|nr:hypothetical protein F5X96DRAFT_610378 [Biscogniauxia mediterranea]
MPGLDDLPVELTCQILESLSIDDIFNARLVNRRLLSVVDSNIKTMAYRIARQDFPRARLLLRPTHEGGAYDLAWLRTLIPRRLASIVLDKHRVERLHSSTSYVLYIPAEDDFGDELRARLAAAWCLLKRINDIYSAVYALPPSAAPTTPAAREDLVYARALRLVDSLEPLQCESFCLLAYLLLSAFEDRDLAPETWRRHLTFHVAQEGEPCRFLDCRPRLRAVRETPSLLFAALRRPRPNKVVVADARHPDRGNAWVWAFLFREGATAFHRQWIGAGRPGHVAARMLALWADADAEPARRAADRETASRVWCALVARSRAPLAEQQPYDSLRNPHNDLAFPAIDRWLRLRRRERRGPTPTPSKSMLAWYLWQRGRAGFDEAAAVVEQGDDAHWGIAGEEAALALDNRDDTDPLSDVPYAVTFRSADFYDGDTAAAADAS